MKRQTNPKTSKKVLATVRGFYSVAEAAALSGVSAATMHRLVKNGRVRASQPAGPGGKVVIPQGNLLAFLDEQASAAVATANAARK